VQPSPGPFRDLPAEESGSRPPHASSIVKALISSDSSGSFGCRSDRRDGGPRTRIEPGDREHLDCHAIDSFTFLGFVSLFHGDRLGVSATAAARQPGVNQMSVNHEFPGSMRPWESMPAAKQGDGTA
jgi:hypothetical protein